MIIQYIVAVNFFTSTFCYSIQMTFKDRLRDEMEYKGLSGKDIASKVGISYSTFLSYIDSRAVLPNVETAVKIANVLGVSVEYLVTGMNAKHNSYSATEEALILNFRNLSKSNQENLLKISTTLK